MNEERAVQLRHAVAGLIFGFSGRPYDQCFDLAAKIVSLVLGALSP